MLFLILLGLASTLHAQALPQILQNELQRNFITLKQKADPPPYFMAYEVTEEEGQAINASMGALESKRGSHRRTLDVTVRVGSPKLDNYHMVRGERARFTPGAPLPLNDAPDAIRHSLWLNTDRTYRLAAQRLIQIKTSQQVNVADRDNLMDFSTEEPVVHEEAPPQIHIDDGAWTKRLLKASAELAKSPGVLTSTVSMTAQRETKYLVNTEGTRLEFGRTFARILIVARGKAPDGMDLATMDTFEATDPARLPDQKTLEASIRKVTTDLQGLLHAPTVDPYIGPAILSGRAAGVFFHEIFGHRVEGERQRDEGEGQTFAQKIGQSVLPDFLSVIFDPTRRTMDGIDLFGWYDYDDQGVKARPVQLVQDGILKTFLMSRTPIQGIDRSNGHGRRQPGLEVEARQSNLIVESKKQVPDAQLRQMLIAEVKRQQRPYGLYFRDITGGFTQTQRSGPQAFTVIPLVVYKVFPDGRPDELIRGVNIVGTPLASFAKIVATSDHAEVFNGYCGAESGTVPVAAISPALLVSEIEVEKKDSPQDRPPLLPAPVEGQ